MFTEIALRNAEV